MSDFFLSFASEDEHEIARPLYEELRRRGFTVWYDSVELRVGDRLWRELSAGLANCRYGVVILSPNYFAKEWTQRELEGLADREILGENVIRPVWHGVDREQITAFSLFLGSRVGVPTSLGIPAVADALERAMHGRAADPRTGPLSGRVASLPGVETTPPVPRIPVPPSTAASIASVSPRMAEFPEAEGGRWGVLEHEKGNRWNGRRVVRWLAALAVGVTVGSFARVEVREPNQPSVMVSPQGTSQVHGVGVAPPDGQTFHEEPAQEVREVGPGTRDGEPKGSSPTSEFPIGPTDLAFDAIANEARGISSRKGSPENVPPTNGDSAGDRLARRSILDVVSTDRTAIYYDPQYLLPGACPMGGVALFNGGGGLGGSVQVPCVDGKLVFRPLSLARWSDRINPNTGHCVTFAARGGSAARHSTSLAGAEGVVTPEGFIGFRVDVSVGDPDAPQVVLSNTPGKNGVNPCLI